MVQYRILNRITLITVVLAQVLLLGRIKSTQIPQAEPSTPLTEHASVGSLPLPVQYALSRDLGFDDPVYHFSQRGKTFEANNPKSGLSAKLDNTGLLVHLGDHTWSVALSAWGRGNTMQHLPTLTSSEVDANRLTYQRRTLSEWFLNGPLGLQQGWHFTEPPTGSPDQPVTLALTLSGDLRSVVRPDKRSLALVDRAGFSVLTYGGLLAYDKTGKDLPTWFESNGSQVLVKMADAGAVYPITIDPWLQATKLTTSKYQDYDQLGYAVAISADGKTIAAGAPRRPTDDSPGRVYVYERPGKWATTPLYTALLTTSDGEADDELGRWLDINADGSVIVAGAHNNDGDGSDGSDQGAVYIFERPDSRWVDAKETAKLTVTGAQDYDNLGSGVAVSEDGGVIVAGALGVNGGGSNRGAAYVFERGSSGWSTTNVYAAILTASDAEDDDWLGWPVSISGDGDTIAASAHAEDGVGGTNRGAVYLYERPDVGWGNATEDAKLFASAPIDNTMLGYSVAVNQDGSIVVAGAPMNSAGAAYLFERPVTGWPANSTEEAKLTVSGSDSFGWSVALDQSGETLAVGDIYHNGPSLTDSGAVYMYRKPVTGWADSTPHDAMLTASDLQTQDYLGGSVSLSDDGATLVASAPYQDGGGTDRGALYVYELSDTSWATTDEFNAKLTAGDGQQDDQLGMSVAISADGSTVVVGAENYNTERGAVYVYERPGSDWTGTAVFSARLTASDSEEDDYLGNSVAVSADGGTLIAGAYDHDIIPTGDDRGAVYVFVRPPGGWATSDQYAAKLTTSDGEDYDYLGWSVDISGAGDLVIAGALGADGAGEDYGAVYVFKRPSGGWADTRENAKLTSSEAEVDDILGFKVALSADGGTIFASAPNQDAGGLFNGAVYVYEHPDTDWGTTDQFDAKLTASDGEDFDLFGYYSLAVDMNGSTVAVGLPDKSSNRGAIYVFVRPSDSWVTSTETAKMTASDGETNDALGYSVALSNDGGVLVAGAPYQDVISISDNRGAVYVYTRPQAGWASSADFSAKLTASDGEENDCLGYAVAVNSDGTAVVASAPYEDSVALSQGAAYIFALYEAPEFTSGTPPSPVPVNQPYSHTFTAKHYPLPSFSITSGSLPPGLTLDGASGVLSGTPTTIGRYSFTVTASNGDNPDAHQEVTIVVGTAPAFTSAAPPSPAKIGDAYNFNFTASGYPTPIFSLANGDLPPGLTLDENSGELSGTCNTAGTYAFTIAASNGLEPQATLDATILVGAPPAFTSGTPPSPAKVGQIYSHTFAASGYPAPSFAVTTGTLPAGLTLDGTTGILSGTPTTVGNYAFTVTASNGLTPDASQSVTILVQEAGFDCLLPLVISNP